MPQTRKIVAEFEDRYGDQRTIHKTRHGMKLARSRSTAAWAMTNAAGKLVGARIKAARIAAGMTLEELTIRAGLSASNPKTRMWEIENTVRVGGVKLGTLYAIAHALNVTVISLMPSVESVMAEANIKTVQLPPTITPGAIGITAFRLAGE